MRIHCQCVWSASSQQQTDSSYIFGVSMVIYGFLTAQGLGACNHHIVQGPSVGTKHHEAVRNHLHPRCPIEGRIRAASALASHSVISQYLWGSRQISGKSVFIIWKRGTKLCNMSDKMLVLWSGSELPSHSRSPPPPSFPPHLQGLLCCVEDWAAHYSDDPTLPSVSVLQKILPLVSLLLPPAFLIFILFLSFLFIKTFSPHKPFKGSTQFLVVLGLKKLPIASLNVLCCF